MFESSGIGKYIFMFGLIVLASYFGGKIKESVENNNDEYDLIKRYILNDSPLYGNNKPKIWIHTTYDVNARKWRDFYSRNTTDLNQPYIHLTIKSIIDHCGNDFHICLIDDETFSKIIPGWDIDLSLVAEPMRSQLRTIALMELLYHYGGMIVPNSFLCMRNLLNMYDMGLDGDHPFVCEIVNRHAHIPSQSNRLLFAPTIEFIGSKKHSPIINEIIELLKGRQLSGFFQSEDHFLGFSEKICEKMILAKKMNMVGGEYIGVKTQNNKIIGLEELMEDKYLDLNPHSYGILIPASEILRRTKYQWFAVMDSNEILKSQMIISKYLKASMVNTIDELYKKSATLERNVISI
jgi:hypothetical protein